jgi:predicted GIY-YIG superfamily endonuclease
MKKSVNKKEKLYTVYMHTSPNNKRYIGITTQTLKRRWGKNGYGYVDNEYFWKAINKYGWDNFSHEILFEDLSRDEALKKEIELIAFYDTTNPDKGYNITAGGSHTLCTKLKSVKQYTLDGKLVKEYECIRDASDETGINKGNISLCCNNKRKTTGGFIWKFSDDELTDEHLAWCNHEGHKNQWIAVHQYSKDGRFIKEHKSLTLASLSVNTTPAHISACCKGKVKFVANFIWRYANEELTQQHIDWCNENTNEKIPILQYSTSNEIIGRFEGILSASRLTGIDPSSIIRCCQHIRKTAGGFMWEYESSDLVRDMKYKIYNPVDQYSMSGKFIKTYKHPAEASLQTKANYVSIVNCCMGKQRKSGDYIWRYHGEQLTEEHIKWCNEVYVQKTKKSVNQYSMNGEFIKEWESLCSIEVQLGYNVSAVSRCCKGKQSFAYGFIWRFADDKKPTKEDIKRCKTFNGQRMVAQYSLRGELIRVYNSITEASKSIGVNSTSSIWGCCSHKTKTAKGYIWRYVDDIENCPRILLE